VKAELKGKHRNRLLYFTNAYQAPKGDDYRTISYKPLVQWKKAYPLAFRCPQRKRALRSPGEWRRANPNAGIPL